MEDEQSATDPKVMEEIREVAEAPEEASEENLLTLLQTPEQRDLASKLLMRFVQKANAAAEERKVKAFDAEILALRTSNEKMMKEQVDKIRKAMMPPSTEEIQTLLNQEYIEFTVKLVAAGEAREFVIRELPLAVEAKVLKVINKTLVQRIQEFSRIDWSMTGSELEKITKIIDAVPGAMETLADCVALCLDPFGQDKTMTGEWVTHNVGLNRLAAILHAQITVSRYRDFFSLAGRFIPGSQQAMI